jgi:hypothetical protein
MMSGGFMPGILDRIRRLLFGQAPPPDPSYDDEVIARFGESVMLELKDGMLVGGELLEATDSHVVIREARSRQTMRIPLNSVENYHTQNNG